VTATEAETGLKVLEALDFDPDIACEAYCRDQGNASRAEWFSIALCCGRPPIPYCRACRTREHVLVRLMGYEMCAACLHEAEPGEKMRRWEPIRGRQ
jgi:hypothetical protein